MTDKLAIFQELLSRNAVPNEHKPVVDELVRRGVLKGGKDRSFIREGGYTAADVEQQYSDAKKFSSPGVVRRMLDSATLGASDEILAGLGAPVDYVMDRFKGKDVSLGEAYGKNLEVQRRLRDDARRATDGYGFAVDLAGGLMAAPAAGMVGAAQAVTPTLRQLAAQGAKIGAPIGAVQAFASTDGDLGERVAAAPTGAFFGGLGGAALAPILPGAIDAVARVGRGTSNAVQGLLGKTPQNMAASQAAVQDFAQAGLLGNEVFGPAVAAAPWQRTTAESLAGSVAGGPLRTGIDRTEAALARRIQDVLQSAGAPRTAEEAGTLVQGMARGPVLDRRLPRNYVNNIPDNDLARYTGLEPHPVSAPATPPGPSPQRMNMDLRNATNFPDQFDAAYEAMRRMAPTMRGPVASPGSQVRGLLDDIRMEGRSRGLIPNDKRTSDIFDTTNPAYETIRQQVNGMVPKEVADSIYSRLPLSLRDMKNMRGEVRRSQTAQPGMRTPDQAFVTKFENAMSDDMQALMRARSRPDMADTMRVIDREYARHRENVVEPLVKKVFGEGVTGERAMSNLLNAAQGGDMRLLRAFYTAAHRGLNERQATATLMSHMARDGLEGFAKNVRSLPPEAHAVMFGASPKLRQSIDRFVRVIDRMEPYLAARNSARTGIDASRVPNMIAAGSVLGGLPTFFAALGGQNAIARFMSSPRYVDWLTRAVQIQARTGMSPQFTAHVARLRGMAGANDAFGRAIVENAGELLRPPQAAAAVRADIENDPRTSRAEAQPRVEEPVGTIDDQLKSLMDQFGISTEQPLDKALDELWSKHPSDGVGELIDEMARRHGVKPPWEKK